MYPPMVAEETVIWLLQTFDDELEAQDPASFKKFVSMQPATFHELLERLGLTIVKKDTWYHKSLYPGLRLVITLHFLATGDSYHSLMYDFRVAHNTISLIVRDECQAIIDIYEDEVVSCPGTEVAWCEIANHFGE